MHILLIIFIIFIVLVGLGLSFVRFVIQSIFGIGRRFTSGSQQSQYRNNTSERNYRQGNTSYSSSNTESSYSESTSNRKQKKIFTEDDGEYVDFEEIKE